MKRCYGVDPRVQEGSLATKLLMARRDALPRRSPRRPDRGAPRPCGPERRGQIERIEGRRFSTRGWIAVQPSPVCAKRILAITRIDHADG